MGYTSTTVVSPQWIDPTSLFEPGTAFSPVNEIMRKMLPMHYSIHPF